MIIIREGLEAILVIAILLSLFTSRRSKTYLFLGALFGIIGSFATYYLAKEIISISTSNRELIEGVSALMASSMLIFVAAWIFHNTYSKGWVEYAKELTEKSMKSGSLWILLFIGFIVVYREGFETVLFYETLANESDPQAVWFGFLSGLLFILIVSVAIVKGIKKLPINIFFSITGIFLSLLAVIFTGSGIRGLQTANVLSATPSDYLQEWQVMRDFFGYSPTLETTLSQVGVLVLLFGFYLYSKYKK
jgi:high-affinity iron transporter